VPDRAPAFTPLQRSYPACGGARRTASGMELASCPGRRLLSSEVVETGGPRETDSMQVRAFGSGLASSLTRDIHR
jgi:hypothetical protein